MVGEGCHLGNEVLRRTARLAVELNEYEALIQGVWDQSRDQCPGGEEVVSIHQRLRWIAGRCGGWLQRDHMERVELRATCEFAKREQSFDGDVA
jgi:hypothetical protein